MEFKGRVSKMGRKKIINIPSELSDSFLSGDYVLVNRVGVSKDTVGKNEGKPMMFGSESLFAV